MWNEVWGSHIVTADAQTQKHNYWGCGSLQCVFVLCCVRVCVCVCLRLASDDLWKWFVTCGGPEDTTLNHIDCSSYYILLFHFFFSCHVTRHFLPPEGCARLPIIVAFRSLQHRSEMGCMMWRRKREEGGRAVDFLWVWVWKHYLLFRGCCSEAAGWRALPAVPNQNWERDALIKKTQWKRSTHTNTHTLSFHVCFENPLFLFTSFTHLVESTLLWGRTEKETAISQ